MAEPYEQIVRTTRFGKRQVLYDGARVGNPDESLFCPAAENILDNHANSLGRAQVVLHEYHGMQLVSKHYYRGGMLAPILGDIYFGVRAERSRSFREWCMLSTMRAQGLPVPNPIAASVISSGLFYRADLVTERIQDVETLADRCMVDPVESFVWRKVGETIRRFHDCNVYHADLNARNILIDDSGEVSLLDFDKSGFRLVGDSWKSANLVRLKRSLDKFSGLNAGFHFTDENWKALLEAYKA